MKSFINHALKKVIRELKCFKKLMTRECNDLMITNIPYIFQSTCTLEVTLDDKAFDNFQFFIKTFPKALTAMQLLFPIGHFYT